MCCSTDTGFSTINRRRMLASILLIIIFIFGFKTSVFAFLTDKNVHPPPSSGTYTYSPSGSPLTCTFCKGAGIPAPGGTYVDPVFGETVRTITNSWPYNASDPFRQIMYNQMPLISANGTYIAVQDQWTEFWFYKVSDGSLWWHPGSAEVQSQNAQFDPSDDDVFYYYTGSQLKRATMSTKTTSVIRTFASSIENGGSAAICDNTGRYFIAMTGNGTVLTGYDRIENALYSPLTIPSADTVDMAPSGDGVLLSYNGVSMTWRPFNHSTNTIGSATIAARPGGQHHTLVTDSSGINWFVVQGSDLIYPEGVAGLNAIVKIRCDSPSTNGIIWSDPVWSSGQSDVYYSATGAAGESKDWFAIARMSERGITEYIDPTPWIGWTLAKNEIILLNVKTGAIRRLCHTRLRIDNSDADYYWRPRLTMSPNGAVVGFMSNMGRCYDPVSSTNKLSNYADVYTVTTGLGVPPSPPKNLRLLP